MWLRVCEWGNLIRLWRLGWENRACFIKSIFFSALDVRVSVEPTVGGCGAGVYNYDLEI